MTDFSTWPRRFPQYTFAWMMASVLIGILGVQVWGYFRHEQRFYLVQYVKASVTATADAAMQVVKKKVEPNRLYLLEDGSTINMPAGIFARLIGEKVYGNQPLWMVLEAPIFGFGCCLVLALVVGGIQDARYNRTARNGRLIRGPKMVTEAQFNRATKGDGIAFQSSKRGAVRMALDKEAHHIQIAGDTGTGKSTKIREILYQVESRGEVAIIFDPDREYIKEFFDESRGDWVLNPKDDRCPFWPMGEECADEAEAKAVTKALYHQDPGDHTFFVNHARAITAYLIATFKPTPNDLADWISSERGVDDRVRGTEHESTLNKQAGPQRSGVFGHLNQAAMPLRLMPESAAGRRTFLIRKWAEERRGWIFITSTPDTLDALRPLQSMWLDMLILKLQNGAPNAKRVWMILDEVATLNQLPQLHSALTRQRKSDNPIVLGFQGMSQIEHLYGEKMAQTILSQAFTNIILRTRESKAAHHLSELIGKAEVERVREHRPATVLMSVSGRSYNSEKVFVPVVAESEIQILDDLEGFFVQLGMVVKIKFQPLPKRVRVAGLIERKIPVTRVAEIIDLPFEEPEPLQRVSRPWRNE